VNGATPDHLITLAAALGLGGVALGALSLRFRAFRLGRAAALLYAACCLALFGVAAYLAAQGMKPAVALAPAALAAAVAATWLSRWGRLTAGLGAALRRPLLPALLLLVGSPLLAVHWAHQLEGEAAGDSGQEIFERLALADPPKLTEAPPGLAFTDLGSPVLLHQGLPRAPQEVMEQLERNHAEALRFGLRAIRTAEPDPAYNCHGWVFTGGKYWVKGREVDPILSQNHYAAVAAPEPGDVAVYRDASGAAVHTALVRAVTEGYALVESKWGSLGRFVHRVEDQHYSGTWTYYRSPRRGHLLCGLGGEGGPADVEHVVDDCRGDDEPPEAAHRRAAD
jgi:hypothetical protein